MTTPLNELPAVDSDSGRVNVVIDTPQGSRNKYKFDEQHAQWRLSKVLPRGMCFPCDFGFIPSTLGQADRSAQGHSRRGRPRGAQIAQEDPCRAPSGPACNWWQVLPT